VRNSAPRPDDNRGVECEQAREAVSATLDGEPPPVEYTEVESHLAGCASCRAWVEAAHRVTRHARLDQVGTGPDRTGRIVAAVLADRRPARIGLTRLGLAALAGAQLLLFAAMLFLGDRARSPHLFHELDTFDLALAAGFLTAARRPSRAAGLLALVGVAAVGLLGTAAIDVAGGRTGVFDEAPHLLAVAGWLLLFRLARAHRDGPYGAAARRPFRPGVPTRSDPPVARDPAA
jgi:predicted anti-sigma-YlaC factor YlaD